MQIDEINACTQINLPNNNTISCVYKKDINGFPLFSGGKHYPLVHIKNVGYLSY